MGLLGAGHSVQDGAMRSRLLVVLLAALLACGLRPAAAQQAAGFADDAAERVVYVVTYFDALPSAAAQARERLSAYAAEARRANGNLQFLALQEIGRPYRFATLEAWRDAEAHSVHSRSADAARTRSGLATLLYSPPDERSQDALLVGERDDGLDDAADAVYVLTHVDVVPPRLEQAIDYLRTLAQASRNETGNLRFDVLVTARRNHMTLVEAWRSAAAQEAHAGAPHAKAFRNDIAPLLGALYDERLYRPLR
jgi:quinol monooxygenase YgiN